MSVREDNAPPYSMRPILSDPLKPNNAVQKIEVIDQYLC